MKRVEIIEEAISGVNIVPVIDVCLVLLVILLLMSPIINIPNLQVELPQANTKETKDQNVTVSLSADGRISVDTDIIDPSQLPSKLRESLKAHKDAFVIVRADKNLNYGNVESLIRTVNLHAGDHAVALATQQRSVPLEVKP